MSSLFYKNKSCELRVEKMLQKHITLTLKAFDMDFHVCKVRGKHGV